MENQPAMPPLETDRPIFQLPAWTQGVPRSRRVQARYMKRAQVPTPPARPPVQKRAWADDDDDDVFVVVDRPPNAPAHVSEPTPEPEPTLVPFQRTAQGTWAWTEPGYEWLVRAIDRG